MDFTKQDSIFDDLFIEFIDYTKSIVFDYLETEYDCDFEVPTRSDVNVDVEGIYLISDELVICDEVISFEYQLMYKDKFNIDGDAYFIDEYNSKKYINDIYNNTIFGQYGISTFLGNSYDPNNFICPALYMILNEERNLSPLEIKDVDIEKTLLFDMGIMVNKDSVFDKNSAYSSYNTIKEFIYTTIGEYFNECPSVVEVAERINEWFYDSKILEETNSFTRGLCTNNVTYY